MSGEIHVDRLVVGQLNTNCYFLLGSYGYIIIDPGDNAGRIIKRADRLETKPLAVICTHGHFDHILAAGEVASNLKIPFCIHENEKDVIASMWELSTQFGIAGDPPAPDIFLKGDETWSIGECDAKLIRTPGHTPGSISISAGKKLFTGDTLFNNGIGRTDLGGNNSQMIESLRRLSRLEEDIVILPGHGPGSVLRNEAANIEHFIQALYGQG